MLRLYLYARVHVLFAQIAHGTAGAACTRSSLRPHLFERATRRCKPRANMSRERETISASLRAQRSNPPLRLACHGLLRCARNDADRPERIRSAGSRLTTFTCINDSGYNASLAETLQTREQSIVPKMRPFKLQMAGQQCSIFLVARSARSADDLISTYQVRKNQRRRTGIAASPTK